MGAYENINGSTNEPPPVPPTPPATPLYRAIIRSALIRNANP